MLKEIVLFPIYLPYKIYKKLTAGELTESQMADLRMQTADHLLGVGFTPEQSMKMSEDFWKKNKDKLKEALKV